MNLGIAAFSPALAGTLKRQGLLVAACGLLVAACVKTQCNQNQVKKKKKKKDRALLSASDV